jgi:5'-nucleotidase
VDIRQPDGSFAPLDPARRYLVATNNFLRAGGDGYVTFQSGAIDPYDTGPGLDEVVARAVAAASPLAPATDGRMVLR